MRDWPSFSFVMGANPAISSVRFLSDANSGVWAIARDWSEQPVPAEAAGTSSGLLLDTIQQQVASGEDLTAAMLVAHGRLSRDLTDADSAAAPGAELIAIRVNRQSSSFEVAWVGDMQAYLVRKKEALLLTPLDGGSGAVGESRTNALLMTATRVPALGLDARVRPMISRRLGHAQNGDTLVMLGSEIAQQEVSNALTSSLAGMWSFDYKVRKLQQSLEASAQAGAGLPVLACRVK